MPKSTISQNSDYTFNQPFNEKMFRKIAKNRITQNEIVQLSAKRNSRMIEQNTIFAQKCSATKAKIIPFFRKKCAKYLRMETLFQRDL